MSASTVRIVKMSGAGNDFVVLDGEQAERLGAGLVPWIRQVCRRGLSVGGDGVLRHRCSPDSCLLAARAAKIFRLKS